MALAATTPAFAYPFLDPDLGLEARISDLLGRMSREEKIHCLSTVPDVPRLGVRGSGHVEGLHGLAMGEVGGWGQGAPVPTTQFPQAYGLGESWDPDLVRRVGEAEGIEVRYLWQHPLWRRGGLVVRAPNADLGRDPRWGRTEECFGEDPCLTGALATAMTRGLQGDDPKYLRCASLLKHFLANSNEIGRGNGSSNFDERLFHEYYAAPFRQAIMQGRAQGFMAAYNAYNGVPCTIHPMLKQVTQALWGHDGIICTDGGAYGMLVTEHHRFTNKAEAAAACIQAGINQFLDTHEVGVRKALHKGLLSETEVDEVLRGVFRVMIRLGQLDPPERVPYAQVKAEDPAPWASPEHQALSREAVRRCAVLLKNEGGLLPLKLEGLQRIALIGPLADTVVNDWYGGEGPYAVSPLQGLSERLQGKLELVHNDGKDRAAAAALAASADLAIVVAGNHPLGHGGWAKIDSPFEGKECFDRQQIGLRDEDLVQAVHTANPRMVLVLLCNFPIATPWCVAHVPAILHTTHSAQELGRGLADLLLGHANPGGKLTQTWPRSLDQLLPIDDYDLGHGRTYLYSKHKPLFPFGYGLSYTQFELSNARLGQSQLGPGGTVSLQVDVKNSGAVDGDEVLQVYVRHPRSALQRPRLALKAFQRVTVPQGQSRSLLLALKADDLRHWDTAAQDWRLEAGPVEVLLGTSSEQIHAVLNLEVQA